MLALSPEKQLSIYSILRALEPRTLALESHVGNMKRTCVHGGSGSIPDLVALSAELKWQLSQLADLSVEVAALLGINPARKDSPGATPEPQAGGVEEPGADGSEDESKGAKRSEPSGMQGSTDVIGVPDLVSTLNNLHKTGTLALNGNDCMFVFEFLDGKVVHAITNKQAPEMRLGTILMAQNTITESQLNDSLDASAAADQPLGAHLVTTATVSEEDLRSALDRQVQMIFREAFELRGARFTFIEGNLSNLAQRTAVSTTELLLEAARMMDEAAHEVGAEPAWATKGAIDSILGD